MNNDALRFPIALLAGLGVAALLYWGLWSFISGPVAKFEAVAARRIEFTRLRRDTETASRRDQKAARERPAVTPQAPKMAMMAGSASTDAVQMLTPDVDARGAMTKLTVNVGGSDRDIIPLVRINPDYPARAQSRGIEGWVLVQFTITPAGTVKDPFVVEAHPKGYFEDAALKAISRWRYNPKIEEGVAVERVGMRNIIRFEMEK
jgi:protein TonB